MKVVIQRVNTASVSVHGRCVGKIENGLLVLLGITLSDTEQDANILAEKISKLRIMSDAHGKMNLSLMDVLGSLLLVSQFTLYGDTAKGNRPSFVKAATSEKAEPLYTYFIKQLKGLGINVAAGIFGADMQIETVLDGPVTIIIEA